MDGIRNENDRRSEDDRLWRLEARAVGVGAAAGFVAGIAMGVIFQFGTDLLPVLGAFTGEASVLRGWLVHLVVSVLYGIVFMAVVEYPPVRSFAASFGAREYVLVGITYAVTMAAVTIGILPFVFEVPWAAAPFQAPGTGAAGAGIDGLVPAALFGLAHIVYGTVLGAVYAAIEPTPG